MPEIDVKKVFSALHLGLTTPLPAQKVLVIGAGIAGLCAAKILWKSGWDVEILEASPRIGGRIHSQVLESGQSIELGAEEIHGEHSIWKKMLESKGYALFDSGKRRENYYQIEGELRAESTIDHPEMDKIYQLWDEVDAYPAAKYTSLAHFMEAQGIADSYQKFLEAWWTAEYGSDPGKIDFSEFLKTRALWSSGEDNYKLKHQPFTSFLEAYFEEVLDKIHFNCQVVRVDYTQAMVQAENDRGDLFSGNQLILTVPLGVLKKASIQFIPHLPEAQQSAIQQLDMDAGLKVFIQFKERCWPEDLGSLFGGALVPEYYTSLEKESCLLTGFVMGEKARYLSHLNQERRKELILRELEDLLGLESLSAKVNHFQLKDWGKDPWTEGAYSYPVSGAQEHRINLARSIDAKIFIAGEASHTEGLAATVQGAIETGYRAAKEILNPKKD